jgi:Mn-dependent DtxR family transcriptional regulator
MPQPEITDRQVAYLRLIRDLQAKEGYPPTLDELADRMKVKTGSVQSVLKSLQGKGLVSWKKGQYRTLVVTAAGSALIKKG